MLNKSKKNSIGFARKLIIFLLSLTLSGLILLPAHSYALSASDWQAGRIIDDDIFSASNTMSVQDIQNFLNAKVPTCDTNGDMPISSSSSQTRKEWALENSKQAPPYTCLKDYYEVPKTQPGLLFSSWKSHTASNQSGIDQTSSLIEFADINGDGKDEPVLIGLKNTGSGMVEFHTWNNDMRTWSATTVISNQPCVDPVNNSVQFADINGDGKDEPVLIGLKNTGSGMVEFHTWNNDMRTWSSHNASNLSAINPMNTFIRFADQNGVGRDSAVMIGERDTQSGYIEINTWNSGFASWAAQKRTNQQVIDPLNTKVEFADTNGDGRQEPILVGLNSTGSGMVEFHIWENGGQTWQAHLSSNQRTVNPSKNLIEFADTNGDGRQEPILVGLNSTGSGMVEFHIWDPGIPASNYGGLPIPPGAISAAQMIYNAAQKNRISPKVILTTIQKESAGPLTVDDWPFKNQYTYAMGAYCPDTPAGCDPSYAGFSIQISESAALFRYYIDNMDQPWWPYKKPGLNTILFNPDAACGSSPVNISNKSTAALYTYTPYQPNEAALRDLYGSGDSCSAFGNRNFWRIYNSWFGSSISVCLSSEPYSTTILRLYNPSNYRHFYTAYSCEASVLQKSGYVLEGPAFYGAQPTSPSAVVVHRLYNASTQRHLWVTTQDEINLATQKAGFTYEGVAFYGVKPDNPNIVAVHRLYNSKTYQHLWVTTQDEINLATQKAGFTYEGVAFYTPVSP